MYYLEKCKKCDRSGSVALKAEDKICNLCKEEKEIEKPKDEDKDEE